MGKIKKNFPPFNEIFLVYSIVNFLAFSWAILVFFYYLSSWILFLPLLDLLFAFCYGTIVVFADVILMLVLTLTLTILLPAKIMRDKFVSVGGIFVMIFFLWTVFLQLGFDAIFSLNRFYVIFLVFAIFVSVAISIYIAHRVRSVAKFVEGFSKRVGIFVALYAPWCLISLIVVIIRNVQ